MSNVLIVLSYGIGLGFVVAISSWAIGYVVYAFIRWVKNI